MNPENQSETESEFNFKPVNQGLGFHHHADRATPAPTPPRQNKSPLLHSKPQKTLSQAQGMPPLGRRIQAKKFPQNASIEMRFLGWLVDLLFIAAIVTIMLASFWMAAGMQIDAIAITFIEKNLFIYGAILFTTIYNIYFTYSDLSTSFGKKILGLKLIHKREKHLTCEMTLTRSLTTFFSLIFLGLPLILDFQGKLSDTKVVKA